MPVLHSDGVTSETCHTCKLKTIIIPGYKILQKHDQSPLAINVISRVRDLGMISTSDFQRTDQCGAADQNERDEVFSLKSALP